MGRWRSLVVVITVAILALPGTVRADGVASAIYGVGVQIGLVELGALEDADPAFLVRALRLARTSATASGCISTTEIDRLITAMSAAERSRPLYERITAYRQQLAREIERECNCSEGNDATATRPSWLHGAWSYRTSRGFTDTHHLLPNGRTRQGGTWSVRDGMLVVQWPNGWRNEYPVQGPTRRLTGVSIGPDGTRQDSTLRRR